jgi:hypothetical protein
MGIQDARVRVDQRDNSRKSAIWLIQIGQARRSLPGDPSPEGLTSSKKEL